MSTLDLFDPVMPLVAPEPAAPAVPVGHPVGRLAGFIDRADPGTRAALARLDPDAMRPHQIAALARALIEAGLSPDTWQPATWKRWALIAHGMALAGHDRTRRLGQQLGTVQSGQPIAAEARVTKLLVSRGDAFLQIVPRLLRLLVSKQVKPNWYDLSKLILKNDSQDADEQEEAEALRLRIAGDYFSAIARAH
jgi:CRISPR system Cascade subunit CasB